MVLPGKTRVIDLDSMPGAVNIPLTHGDKTVIEWAYESLKDSPKIMVETLRHVATLSAALLAGSVAFMKDFPAIPKACLVICLFVALVASVVGFIPVAGPKDPSNPAEIRRERAKAIRWRGVWIWIAVACLLLAGASAAAGAIWQSFYPAQQPCPLHTNP